MKALLIVFVITISGVIGKTFSKNYVLRETFLKELISLFNYVKNSIEFKQSKLKDVFLEYDKVCGGLKNKYVSLINENFIKNEFLKNEDLVECYFLSKEEKQNIIQFFNGLGNFNGDIESLNITNFLNVLESYKKDACEKRRKNEGAVYKLSLAFGAAVCILII